MLLPFLLYDIIDLILVTARFRQRRIILKGGDMSKKIELWEGYEVEFNENIANDFDFVQDLSTAVKNNDLAEVVTLYFALIGGQKVYDDFREYVISKKGFFDINEVQDVLSKVDANLPKAGNRAQRRSWQTSK